MSILYSAEGGFELPQRTFDALVKIAHYYNYNASATPAASAGDTWKTINRGGSGGRGRGGGLGNDLKEDPAAATFRRETLPSRESMSSSVDHNNDAAVRSAPADSFSSAAADKVRSPSGAAGGCAGSATEPTATEAVAEAAVAAETVAVVATEAAAWGFEGGDGAGATQQQSTEAPRNEPQQKQQQQPVGDDWYTEGGERSDTLAHRNINNDHGSSGGGGGGGGKNGGTEDAWSRTAREITRLWVRAVGSLCCPSHSELWPHLIDVGILGALNT